MHHHFELVFQPEVRAIMDHFCGLLRVRIAFFSLEGDELEVGKDRGMCSYCRLVRSRLGYEPFCHTLDVRVREEVAKSGALKAYVCHGGMIEAVMPVLISGRVVGYIMIGQFRQRRNPPANVLKKTPPALRHRLAADFSRTPLLTPAQVKHTLGMFELLVRYVSEKRLINVHDALHTILDRLRESPELRPSLQEAANLAGCSPAVLSRLFRKKFGQSYSTTRIQLLLDKADRLFRENPGIQIQQVADRLGFEDPLYFSRLYRRKRGVSPRTASRRQSVLK